MLLGGATVPPTETLVVEDELLLPEEEPPLVEDGLAASEEVPPPALLLGAGPFGTVALNLGGSILKLVGRPVMEFELLPLEEELSPPLSEEEL